MSSEWDIENYKIRSLVSEKHDATQVCDLNFKTHLKADATLAKHASMREDGRPTFKTLTDPAGVVYGIVRTWWLVDGGGMVQRKTKDLTYIKNDGSEGPAIRIFDKVYAYLDLVEVVKEKRRARENLVDKIKADVLVGLTIANPEMSERDIVNMGIPFAAATGALEKGFIDYGFEGFQAFIATMDATDPAYSWAATPVAHAPLIDMRDYMLDVLEYASVTDHPEHVSE